MAKATLYAKHSDGRMRFVLFDDVLPVAGETQIRTEGLRVSSYATDREGLPFLSELAGQVLRQALRDKQLLEQSRGCWLRPKPASWNDQGEIIDSDEPVATISHRAEPMPAISGLLDPRVITFTRGDNDTFIPHGEGEFQTGVFEWSDDGGEQWTGSPAIVGVDELLGRMALGGPYKPNRQYRIVERAKPKLIIDPCCTSCGLAGDVSRPLVIEQQHCNHQEKCHHEHNHCAFNEPCEHCDHSEPGEYSTFFKARVGQTVRVCDYVIDATVTNASHVVPAGFKTNAYGQIVAGGYQGQFCSAFCLAMELFLYRNRRCAACAKLSAKKDWTSPEQFQGKTYPKYKYCCEPCKKRWHKHEHDILTTEHVVEVLGMAAKAQARPRARASKRAKDLVWQNAAQDLNATPRKRDFCRSVAL